MILQQIRLFNINYVTIRFHNKEIIMKNTHSTTQSPQRGRPRQFDRESALMQAMLLFLAQRILRNIGE